MIMITMAMMMVVIIDDGSMTTNTGGGGGVPAGGALPAHRGHGHPQPAGLPDRCHHPAHAGITVSPPLAHFQPALVIVKSVRLGPLEAVLCMSLLGCLLMSMPVSVCVSAWRTHRNLSTV